MAGLVTMLVGRTRKGCESKLVFFRFLLIDCHANLKLRNDGVLSLIYPVIKFDRR